VLAPAAACAAATALGCWQDQEQQQQQQQQQQRDAAGGQGASVVVLALTLALALACAESRARIHDWDSTEALFARAHAVSDGPSGQLYATGFRARDATAFANLAHALQSQGLTVGLTPLGSGSAAARLAALRRAAQLYKKSLAIQPAHPVALRNLGNLECDGSLGSSGRGVAKAMQLLRKSMRLQPQSPAAASSLAACVGRAATAQRELIPQAIAAFEEALRVDGGGRDGVTLFNFGVLLMQAGGQERLMRAASVLSRALKLRPAHAKSMSALGACLAQLKRRKEARRLLQRALQLAPADEMVAHNFATFRGTRSSD
jgi:tetratricopeptide (TPR) repeat protein